MAEVLRQCAVVSPTVVAVVDHDFLDLIEQEWRQIPQKM
jgi:hypothetical protein